MDSGPDDAVLVVANPDAMTDSTTGSGGAGEASVGMPAGTGASVAVAVAAAVAAAASASASGDSIDSTSSDAIDTMMPGSLAPLPFAGCPAIVSASIWSGNEAWVLVAGCAQRHRLSRSRHWDQLECVAEGG